MKPFYVLIAVSILALCIIKWGGGAWGLPISAQIAMSSMLVFTAVGHFVFAEGMAMMAPDFIPIKKHRYGHYVVGWNVLSYFWHIANY